MMNDEDIDQNVENVIFDHILAPQGPKIANFKHFGQYLIYKSWDRPNFLHGAKRS